MVEPFTCRSCRPLKGKRPVGWPTVKKWQPRRSHNSSIELRAAISWHAGSMFTFFRSSAYLVVISESIVVAASAAKRCAARLRGHRKSKFIGVAALIFWGLAYAITLFTQELLQELFGNKNRFAIVILGDVSSPCQAAGGLFLPSARQQNPQH